MMTQPAKLALEDGTVFTGTSFGATGEVDGEVVFNTSMTGYQEILTDPSYRGQIVTMTYPQIGNYGVNDEDVESTSPPSWLVSSCVRTAGWRAIFAATGSLHDYLVEHGIVGLAGIDTRALVRRIRSQGAMKGVLSSVDLDDASLVEKAQVKSRVWSDATWCGRCFPENSTCWQEGLSQWAHLCRDQPNRPSRTVNCMWWRWISA